MGRTSNTHGRDRKYKIFITKPEGKEPLGRPRHEWKDKRMDLTETGCEGADWSYLPQERDQ